MAAESKAPEGQAAKVLEFKELGNQAFKAHHFDLATSQYTKGLDLDPTNAILLCNRAQCHIKLERYGSAVIDATSAIQANKKFSKAYYRRGSAYIGLLKLKLAEKDFAQAAKLNPKDRDCRERLKEVKKTIKEQAFLKAIETKDEQPSTHIQLDQLEIESGYEGPKLGESYTAAFAEELMEHFKNQKLLPRKFVYKILLDSVKLLSSLPPLLAIPVPKNSKFTVCGDTHGQFYDVLNIFKLNGVPAPDNPYLFNGDFVDRGSFSLEVILTFLVFKNLYPNHFHLTRGNHESLNMNSIYGFEGEVKKKVDAKSFDLFTECFNWLPLGAVIGSSILVVHGGLFSEDGVKLSDIRKIDRFRQPPDSGLMCEMLWSDPQPETGRAPSKRGVGLSFGPDVSERFLKDNGLKMLIRSHEVKEEGYEVMHDGRVVTVFSAPNYCDSMGNKGAFVRLDGDLNPSYHSFEAVPHPPIQPMAYASPMFRF
eukprot:gb/GEZN01006929.1/.p1 GENE.gb/GEZN01006929.1/~~gb/GEZN01006929.1/.p1  ORF type:complete len:480 (-),score=69.69 gb/GEZN01006929.1/:119-1558(-)